MVKFVFLVLVTAGGAGWLWLEQPSANKFFSEARPFTGLMSSARYENHQMKEFAFINTEKPFSWALDEGGTGELGFGGVFGEIRNLGPDRRIAFIEFDLINESGQAIGRVTDMVTGLAHGEVWNFHAQTTGVKPAQVRFAGIEAY